jgi:hypothetical protein
VDIVLIRREHGELSASAKHDLPSLIRRLNRFTLVEFKGPTDTLAAGDLDSLFGCAHLFRAQQQQSIPRSDLNLIVLAPARTQPFSNDLESLGLATHEEEPGIHRLDHPLFSTWLIETDRITGPNEPVLSLFSRVFLKEKSRIIHELKERTSESVLNYTLQQVQQFAAATKGIPMQHMSASDAEEMQELVKELRAAILPDIPVEERLRGIPVEKIFENLDERGLARMRKLLEHPKGHTPVKKRKRK